MREFLREILHALEAGQPVELVSVVRASGSTPRGAGAMMAVFADGHAESVAFAALNSLDNKDSYFCNYLY